MADPGRARSPTRSPIQLGEVGERAAQVAAERVEQRLGLVLARPGRPHRQAGANCPRGCCPECARPQRASARPRPRRRSCPCRVGSDDRLAGPLIGILADPARAEHVAGAHLEQAASSCSRPPAAAGRLRGRHLALPLGVTRGGRGGDGRAPALADPLRSRRRTQDLGAWRPFRPRERTRCLDCRENFRYMPDRAGCNGD